MTQEEIAASLADVDSRAKSNTHRLDKMEKRQDNLDKLVSAVAGLQKDMEHTNGVLNEVRVDVKSMMDAPRKRWDTVLTVAFTAIVSAVVGAILALIIK